MRSLRKRSERFFILRVPFERSVSHVAFASRCVRAAVAYLTLRGEVARQVTPEFLAFLKANHMPLSNFYLLGESE